MRTAASVVLVLGVSLLPPLGAQTLPRAFLSGSAEAPVAPRVPEDPLGRTTPYGAAAGLIETLGKRDYKTAARYLDSNLPDAERQELARQLKFVIDRGLVMDFGSLSHDPEGAPDDNGLSATEQHIGTVHSVAGNLPIYLDRVRSAAGIRIWLFSAKTLKEIPRFAEAMQPSWLESHVDAVLPEWLQHTTLLTVPLARWLFGLGFVVLAFGGAWLMTMIAVAIIARVARKLTKRVASAGEMGVTWPLRFLFLIAIVHLEANLAITFGGRRTFTQIEFVLAVFALVWLGMRATDAIGDIATRRSKQEAMAGRIAVIRLARDVSKTLLVISGLLAVLAAQGFNLSAIVAGLGIGGIAIAFAAQKTIENLFGTVMIVMDCPMRVGDICKIGDATGTIEEVGLRSTRVRTPEHTVLTVPNAQLAAMTIENISARGKILFRHTLGLTYGSNSNQMSAVLDGIQVMLRQHLDVEGESVRVRLLRLGGASLDVEVFAYVLTRDFPTFLGVQQDLLLRCMQIVEACGASFARPSQTINLADRSKVAS